MSWTAHKDEEQIKERFEESETVEKKAKQLAELIKNSKHFVIFTGAGISTSSGIPDFRGPQGVWTLSNQGKRSEIKSVSVLKALPTKTHMAIKKLQEAGLCKYLISQNVDGLHLRSGIDPKMISELHGNTNLEICEKCGSRYLRDFSCREAYGVKDHRTSRKCTKPNCGGVLLDSIINFGENLPEQALRLGFENSDKADLCLVLGSSLTVTPAANMPKVVGKKCVEGKANLCIVNLQLTPLDKYCSIHVHAKCDEFMELVMKELKLDIPPFTLTRRLKITNAKKNKLLFEGIDTDGTPVSFIKHLEYSGDWTQHKVIESAPFLVETKGGKDFTCVLHFMGHYKEPVLKLFEKIDPKVLLSAKETFWKLNYNPNTGIWKVKQEKVEKDELEILSSELKDIQISLPKGCVLTIGNRHEQLKENHHQWTCYVENNKKDLIEKVTFDLHETFFPPTVNVTEAPFQVQKIGWGVFDVNITVHWKPELKKEPSKFVHTLQFQKDDLHTCHKITF